MKVSDARPHLSHALRAGVHVRRQPIKGDVPAFQVPGASSVGGTIVSRLAGAPNFIGRALLVLFLEA